MEYNAEAFSGNESPSSPDEDNKPTVNSVSNLKCANFDIKC